MPTVALAQVLLTDHFPNIMVDGIFGPQTQRFVEAFQQAQGSTVTGRVDQDTWDALTRGRPLGVAEAIDAGDITVLLEDEPHLNDGHATVYVQGGMSGGVRDLVLRLVATNRPQSVALLRLHGHGSPGHMVVSSGRYAAPDTTLMGEHFHHPEIRADALAFLGQLSTIMAPYGSMELHGCNVGARRNGRRLLTGLATACRVPVTAGLRSQRGGAMASRFEGPTLTVCPQGRSLRAWAASIAIQTWQ